MNTRKDFLLASSLLTLAPALADAATPTPSPSPSPKAGAKRPPLTFTFDRARFDEILAKPVKHKQCFGAIKLVPDVLDGMNNSINAYEEYLKEGVGAMQAAAVLYHGFSIALAFNDALWNEYLIPLLGSKQFQKYASAEERDAVAKVAPGKGNPFLHSASSDPDDVSVERLVSRGSSFFVCHNAIAGASGFIADSSKQPVEKVHAAIMNGIVPGALAVPAGVMAVNACQEAKFTYIQSSL